MARVDRLPPPPEVPVRSPAVAVEGEVETHVKTLGVRAHVEPNAERAVVICHPHPLYGGSMHSPVPLAIAKACSERGASWARFDFRDAFDDGRGEVDDARAVIDHVARAAPRARIAVCGHSFGSWVGLRAAAHEPRVDRVLLVAPSARFFEFREDAFLFAGDKTIFLGDHDEFCDVAEARELADKLGADLRIFEGFDHHFLKSRRAMALAAVEVLLR